MSGGRKLNYVLVLVMSPIACTVEQKRAQGWVFWAEATREEHWLWNEVWRLTWGCVLEHRCENWSPSVIPYGVCTYIHINPNTYVYINMKHARMYQLYTICYTYIVKSGTSFWLPIGSIRGLWTKLCRHFERLCVRTDLVFSEIGKNTTYLNMLASLN